jgi:hypothetical protein
MSRRAVALWFALAAAGWLLSVAKPAPTPTRPTPTLKQSWPAARIVTSDGRLPDGADYRPQL